MITEYEIKFTISDIGRAPENFRELLNDMEKLGLIDHLIKAEESEEYDLSKPYNLLIRKTLFKAQ